MILNGEYSLKNTKSAQKKKKKIEQYPALKRNVQNLLDLIKIDPYQNPPPYEKLLGNLSECYSRRINAQHRLVYTVDEDNKLIRIISMWTHYEF